VLLSVTRRAPSVEPGVAPVARRAPRRVLGIVAIGAALLWSSFLTVDYDALALRIYPRTQIRRDHAASVVATGEGRTKWLLVNGIGMTALTPITKFMVHLPLAMHRGRAESALIICFGMGTTFRSALSWRVETTAVELVASVRDSFPYYHDDAARVAGDPLGSVVIDDGRRFLARTQQSFDVIVIDPPPPIQAAGSSLLYSEEFYALAKRRLKPGGILQAWLPDASPATAMAVVRAVHRSFPHVRHYLSVEGWGLHMLASLEPIDVPGADELARRLPPLAQKDLLEWSPTETVASYLGRVLAQEDPERYALRAPEGPSLSDDRPFNEYYLLREWGLLRD
jgi:hypothetical protein